MNKNGEASSRFNHSNEQPSKLPWQLPDFCVRTVKTAQWQGWGHGVSAGEFKWHPQYRPHHHHRHHFFWWDFF